MVQDLNWALGTDLSLGNTIAYADQGLIQVCKLAEETFGQMVDNMAGKRPEQGPPQKMNGVAQRQATGESAAQLEQAGVLTPSTWGGSSVFL